jgi:hypothetical protein
MLLLLLLLLLLPSGVEYRHLHRLMRGWQHHLLLCLDLSTPLALLLLLLLLLALAWTLPQTLSLPLLLPPPLAQQVPSRRWFGHQPRSIIRGK